MKKHPLRKVLPKLLPPNNAPIMATIINKTIKEVNIILF